MVGMLVAMMVGILATDAQDKAVDGIVAKNQAEVGEAKGRDEASVKRSNDAAIKALRSLIVLRTKNKDEEGVARCQQAIAVINGKVGGVLAGDDTLDNGRGESEPGNGYVRIDGAACAAMNLRGNGREFFWNIKNDCKVYMSFDAIKDAYNAQISLVEPHPRVLLKSTLNQKDKTIFVGRFKVGDTMRFSIKDANNGEEYGMGDKHYFFSRGFDWILKYALREYPFQKADDIVMRLSFWGLKQDGNVKIDSN
jgi:hypothetical protein